MKRKEIEHIHTVKYGTKKLPRYVIESLQNQFYYKCLYGNCFIDFMENKINQVCAEDRKFKEALDYIKCSKKEEGISVNKSDRSEKLKECYNLVSSVVKEKGLLNTYSLATEFRKQVDQIYNFYLDDDIRSYTIDEKMVAYTKFFKDKEAREVHKKRPKDTYTLTSKPQYTNGNEYKRAFTIAEEHGYYYVNLRDCTNKTMDELINKYYDKETHKIIKRFRYPQIKFRIYTHKNEIMKDAIKDINIRGGIKIERAFVRGKYRYMVDISYMTQSPIYKDYVKGNLRTAINVQTQTRAIVRSDGSQEILELAPNLCRVNENIIKVQQYLDNSRRAMNPNLYKEDGQIKYNKEKMKELGLEWIISKRAKRAGKLLTEYYRSSRCKRKLSNDIQAKKDVQNCNYVILDKNQIKAWGTKINRMCKGSQNRYDNGVRKANDYAKKLQDRAPGYYTARIKHNCEQMDIQCETVQGFNSSSYNPFTQQNDIFEKLNNRSLLFDNDKNSRMYNPEALQFIDTCQIIKDGDGNEYFVQRDLFAASKLLYCYPQEETRISKDGKEYKTIVWYINNDEYMKFFKEVFYPKHLEYLKELNNQKQLGLPINETIFGC